MKWRGRRQSSNFEDRRSSGGIGGGFGRGGLGGGFRLPTGGGGGRGGGIGIGGLIILGIICFALGINPLTLLTGGDTSVSPGGSSSSAPATTESTDEMTEFVRVVLADTEDVWDGIFQQAGESYPHPRLVVFTGSVDAGGCGYASSASGPFYCPTEQQVYIDLAFYEELRRQFEAPGDFAQAYVIAHEVGHHVQNVIGVLPEFNRRRQSMSEADANAMSVRVELQADCFAGIWARSVEAEGFLEEGDIEEALNAAQQIGDDAIQQRTQGYVVPESFNHGTSEQRQRWFRAGYDSGDMGSCDTINARSL
jgi:predicted metalloprotease